MENGYDFEVCGDDVVEYRCPICALLLREVQEMPCTHSACKMCLSKWEGEQQQRGFGNFKCPSCQTVYKKDDVHAGKLLDRIIKTSLKVNCKQEECDWTGTISIYYENHVRNCKYLPVKCSNDGCQERIARHELPKHQLECQFKKISCKYCNEEIPSHDMENHMQTCGYIPVLCSNGCGATVPKLLMEDHLQTVCFNIKVNCPFKEMGCPHMIRTHYMESHLKEFNSNHMILLFEHTMGISKELSDLKQSTAKEINELQSRIHQQKIHHQNEIDNLKNKIVKLENKLAQQKERNEEEPCTIEEMLVHNIEERLEETRQRVQAIAFLTTSRSLTYEERKKDWTFDELEELLRSKEFEKFNAIIGLKPELCNIPGILLHEAIKHGSSECIEFLIQNGSKVMEFDKQNITDIHIAARDNKTTAIEILLDYCPSLINVQTNSNGDTPLHFAAWKGNIEAVELLLKYPLIEVDVENVVGKTADNYGDNEDIKNTIATYRSSLECHNHTAVTIGGHE